MQLKKGLLLLTVKLYIRLLQEDTQQTVKFIQQRSVYGTTDRKHLLLTILTNEVMQSTTSVCFHSFLNQVTFDLAACVWVMTIVLLGLKVKSKVRVKGGNAVSGPRARAILVTGKKHSFTCL